MKSRWNVVCGITRENIPTFDMHTALLYFGWPYRRRQDRGTSEGPLNGFTQMATKPIMSDDISPRKSKKTRALLVSPLRWTIGSPQGLKPGGDALQVLQRQLPNQRGCR